MTTPPVFRSYFIGEQSLLIQCAELFLAKEHTVLGIISDTESIRAWARGRGLEVLSPKQNLNAALGDTSFDYLFSITNFKILSNNILSKASKGAINYHDGLLPSYGGRNVTAWSLINGEREHGITWHLMTEAVDEGNILLQKRFPVAEGETSLSLNAKCYEVALASFADLIETLSQGEMKGQPASAPATLYAKNKRPEAACIIDLQHSAETINALVRGLEFGPYANPLGLPKLYLGEATIITTNAEILSSSSRAEPGTVVVVNDNGVTLTTTTYDVKFSGLQTLDGQILSPAQLQALFSVGRKLPRLTVEQKIELTKTHEAWSKYEEFWVERLRRLEPYVLPYSKPSHATTTKIETKPFVVPPVSRAPSLLISPRNYLIAVYVLYLFRLTNLTHFDVPYRSAFLNQRRQAIERRNVEGLFASHVPLSVSADNGQSVSSFFNTFNEQLTLTENRYTYLADLPLRSPELREAMLWQGRWSVALEAENSPLHADADLELVVAKDGRGYWRYDSNVFDEATIERMQDQVKVLFGSLATATPETPIGELSILSQGELELFRQWNATETIYPDTTCVHELFEEQVQRTPDDTAVVFQNVSLSYEELNSRANQLAHYLIQQGVGVGSLVGVLMERSEHLPVALLGILKAGAAYVPLDPHYPLERLHFMIEDANVAGVLTDTHSASLISEAKTRLIALDRLQTEITKQSSHNPNTSATARDLAYVIYTSGSTGKPKGVMVEHSNVVNFFTGMSERLQPSSKGVWLAVTSISFDISVLELFWTLTQGFKVVLNGEPSNVSVATNQGHSQQPIDFSLYYFASDEGEKAGRDKYSLLLEGAKFADANGFAAVWTPERHFHAFGGLYPNPSVAAAALATITENVQIRAGSCVLPLHTPIRIAEEWGLVDNLSNGRVGISFASGWQPNDFVIAPQNYEARQKIFQEGIETVRALWRGESRTFMGPKGEVSIRTLPRPVQAELPFWVTAAGNPETFRLAGEMGANLLTHLLGQSLEELSSKLEIYRQAWRDAGHAGEGKVTLMLHTFVAEDETFVREQVRQPLKNYLRTATNLVKQYASAFPTLKANSNTANLDEQFKNLSEEDTEAILEYAFERYYQKSGLFGTPESCLAMVDGLKKMGVDEIASLIDFGVPSDTVLEHLPSLNRLRQLANPQVKTDDYSIPALMKTHKVTHLQCTPSLARMLTLEPQARESLRSLQKLMIGGEAFPSDLAKTLTEIVQGEILNMYGPTETTIWSTTHEVDEVNGEVPIGTPIANTQIYLLDDQQKSVPLGVPGELVIGGAGVVRGYLNRPELTAERFIELPLTGRLYRTGDLARYRSDGVLEFLGRSDFQVKIRGHRIELGEIETQLSGHPLVRQCVVVAREDTPGDKRLVAYIIPERKAPTSSDLREFLKDSLPDAMIPAAFVAVDAFPLTPNKKIDRKALPAPTLERLEGADFIAPRTKEEQLLADVWERVLGVEQVGVRDNFFELGGDSLLAVHALSQARKVGLPFALGDLFQHPTIEALTARIDATTIAEKNGAEQGLVTGSVPLVPSQHRYFYERGGPDPQHWNIALTVEPKEPINPELLQKAVRAVLGHHDALRMRFKQEGNTWQQWNAGLEDDLPLSFIDLSHLNADEQRRAIEQKATETQYSLDLSNGPIVRIVHFNLGANTPQRLLVVIHHLVLGPVSWRIFWEDFQTAYHQLLRGEDIKLAAKTDSFKAWAESLETRARTMDVKALEQEFPLPWSHARPLPLDFAQDRFADNVNAAYGVTSTFLSESETQLLLKHTQHDYRIDEIFITALVQTFNKWSGHRALLMDIVGLARMNTDLAVDLSRTLGYFVTYTPVLVSLEPRTSSLDALHMTAKQLRQGLPIGEQYELLRWLRPGYQHLQQHRAEVLFNYRAAQEYDQSYIDRSLFTPLEGLTGPSHSPKGLRHHPFNMAADLYQGRLKFTLTYSKNLHRSETAETLVKDFSERVRLLLRALTTKPELAAKELEQLTA
jgi:natural product biosynthesis luciferase-like monooxygenase protein